LRSESRSRIEYLIARNNIIVTYPAVFTSIVLRVRLAAGRRTLTMCCYTEVVLFSIVAFKTLTFHKVM